MPSRRFIVCFLAAALTATTARAINIQLDYSLDTFFATHPTAKAALDAAAADVSAAITTSLGATIDTNQGVNGSTTATFDFKYAYTNPTTGGDMDYDPAVVAADTVVIFAGARNLTGATLGQGGPGGFGASFGLSGFTSEYAGAVNAANAAANNNMPRSGGPVIGNLSGNFGGTPYSVDFGSAIGSITFDTDTDNAGGADSEAVLNAFWHFDHTAPVPFEKFDFYSVAVHELLHAVGFGASDSWDALVSGTDWAGSEVAALLGTGADVLHSDPSHIKPNTMSPSIVDGAMQEAAMDPSLTNGDRKHLTELDLAFLRDIGWQTISTNAAPGDFDGDGDVDDTDIDMYVGLIGPPTSVPPADAKFDLNGDNVVNYADYALHAATLLEWSNAGSGQSGAGTLLADFNRDGLVDLLDLDRLGASWNTSQGWNNGDTNGDGLVDVLDLNRLGQNWQQDILVAPSTAPATPEPTALALLALGGTVLFTRRCRRPPSACFISNG